MDEVLLKVYVIGRQNVSEMFFFFVIFANLQKFK